MTTIAEFLLARVAEDEVAARDAMTVQRPRVRYLGDGKWGERYNEAVPMDSIRRSVTWYVPEGVSSPADIGTDEAGSRLFERFNPARVLAECEAKRRIVEEHQDWPREDGGYCAAHDGRYLIEDCPTLQALAGVYADHPDFNDAWRL